MLSVMMELYPTGRSLAKQLPTEYAILQQVKTERELKSQAYLETKKQDANEQLPYDWDEVEDIVTGKFGLPLKTRYVHQILRRKSLAR